MLKVERHKEGVVDRALRRLGRTRRVALYVPHFVSAPVAVASSDLICTVAASAARRGREVFAVGLHTPPVGLPFPGVCAWRPRQHDDDPARRWLRDLFVLGRVLPA